MAVFANGTKKMPDLLSEFFIKRRHVVPEIRFTATDARMARLDRKTRAVVKLYFGTVIIGFRAPASHRVKAVPHFGFL